MKLRKLKKYLPLLLAGMLLSSCQSVTPINDYCLIANPIYDYDELLELNDDLFNQITQHNRTYACLCDDLTKEEIELFKCKGN